MQARPIGYSRYMTLDSVAPASARDIRIKGVGSNHHLNCAKHFKLSIDRVLSARPPRTPERWIGSDIGICMSVATTDTNLLAGLIDSVEGGAHPH